MIRKAQNNNIKRSTIGVSFFNEKR